MRGAVERIHPEGLFPCQNCKAWLPSLPLCEAQVLKRSGCGPRSGGISESGRCRVVFCRFVSERPGLEECLGGSVFGTVGSDPPCGPTHTVLVPTVPDVPSHAGGGLDGSAAGVIAEHVLPVYVTWKSCDSRYSPVLVGV